MSLITLRTYSNPSDANLMKATLEMQGITCFLFDENLVTINPLYSQMVGGIKLKIDESDKERALEILKEIDEEAYTDDNENIIHCPRCESENISGGQIKTSGFLAVLRSLISLSFATYPIHGKTVYRCNDCGKEFK